jgi:hypothetical protein
VALAVEESKQRRDARFAVTAGTLSSQPNKAPLGWQKGIGETIASKGDLRGDFSYISSLKSSLKVIVIFKMH